VEPLDALFEAAKRAQAQAYAPYSGFKVGAALATPDGAALVTPCGACRQRIREFAGPDTPIHAADRDGLRRSFTLDALLPFAFGPDNLESS
jgi:cytidine deaminase